MINDLLISDDAKDTVNAFIKNPTHATIFTSRQGSELMKIAESIATTLLRTKDLSTEQYVRIISPEKNSISVDSIRELQKFFALVVPGSSAIKRVVILERADKLTVEAQNALLKTLEEPPEGSILLLITDQPELLLSTIRSRSRIIVMPSLKKSQVLAYFAKDGHSINDVERAYLLSGGDIDKLKAILSGDSIVDTDLVRTILAGKPYDRLLHVDALSKDKPAALAFVTTLTNIAANSLERATGDTASLKRWQNVLQASVTAGDALDKNGNTKLVLTDLMLSI